jgi:hypothetical protein
MPFLSLSIPSQVSSLPPKMVPPSAPVPEPLAEPPRLIVPPVPELAAPPPCPPFAPFPNVFPSSSSEPQLNAATESETEKKNQHRRMLLA